MDRDKIFSIWFSQLAKVGLVTKKELMIEYETAENIYYSKEADDWDKSLTEAENIYKECIKKEIDIISFDDSLYPPLLRKISNPPPVLYKKGMDIDYSKYPMVSVVGSRLVSDYGRNVTEKISRELSQSGFIVVSGMAAGVDGIAHRSVLLSGGVTVAVLGCGVDIIYPFENSDVYEKLCLQGAVLSEYPPGTKPNRTQFPQRNRIVSGMCNATVVTEARFNSGSLITARTANTQGRKVFAVPQNINSPYGQGTNGILKDYASVITQGSDAFDYYIKNQVENEYTPEMKKPARKRATVKNAPKNLPPNLSLEERCIIKVLKGGIKHIDKISEETGYPLGKVNAVASLLEIKGIIYSVMGNAYGITDSYVTDEL